MALTGAAIRQLFLDYFEREHQHLRLPSASLIPSNPTVLLTPAGMLPFVPIFLGLEPPTNPPRATSSQKCARVSGKASDLEYVGRTPRHHTFFEMLGNFSFGDYFKPQAIPMAWRFVTDVLKLPTERLFVTVYYQDTESRAIWENEIGLPPEKVISRDEKDNFWGPPGATGPCGPCTEIFYDWGPAPGEAPATYVELLDADSERVMEIWNLVFMELFKDDQGQFSPLEKKNVDTGMGLERVAMVMQGVKNTFETDLLFPIVQKMADLTGKRYGDDTETDVALKILADHLRLVAFAVADGIIPSNEGRGYVVRMILRRAVRYAKKLGVTEPLLFKALSTIRDHYQEAYPELKAQYTVMVDTVKAEERRFLETLERGNQLLQQAIASAKASQQNTLPGDEAFKLYDTYGFPIELTREIAAEEGLAVDDAGFEAALNQQRETARAAQGEKTIVSDQTFAQIFQQVGPSAFVGYDTLDAPATIRAIIAGGQSVTEFGGVNQPVELILDQTPFYPESGGQVGDRGILYVAEGQAAQTIVVKNTIKVGELIVHQCLFDQGAPIRVGQAVQGEVAPDARQKSARNHSATHLLHAALKRLLGEHVHQAGSYVGPEGARFDFTFQRALTAQELQQLEMMVNQEALQNTTRQVEVMDLEAAKASGALAMFNEKYGDAVRVVSFGRFSKELCGGTHVERLGDIGLFKITSEGAVASGVRRIEFVTGDFALHHVLSAESMLATSAGLLKVPPKELSERLEKLLAEKKTQEKQLRQLQEKVALEQIHQALRDAASQGPLPAIWIQTVDATAPDLLKPMAEAIAQRVPEHVILLGANIEGRAHFVAMVSQDFQAKGIQAGQLVKEAASQCDGSGGGKPGFAQAGGKSGAAVPQALAAVKQSLQAAV